MTAPVQVGPSPSSGGLVPSLTDHERRVLELIALGHTHEQIAAQLVMTAKGVTPTVNRAMRKLGANNAPHAVFLAVRAGILDPKQRHGDHAGFIAHQRRGEDPWTCQLGCPEGERAYRRRRRAARREADAAWRGAVAGLSDAS